MRGYVETMERLAYHMPEGREPTDLEVCTAMADRLAARIDAARDMPMPNRPVTDDDEVPGGEDQGEICKPISQTNEE